MHGVDINKPSPESDIVLASHWSTAGEEPVSAVQATYFALHPTSVSLTSLSSYVMRSHGRRVSANYICHLSVLVPLPGLLLLLTRSQTA
jgi:hypothetical protein